MHKLSNQKFAQKYFKNFVDDETKQIAEKLRPASFENILCIPLRLENKEFETHFESIKKLKLQGPSLVVYLNNLRQEDGEQSFHDGEVFLKNFLSNYPANQITPHALFAKNICKNLNVLFWNFAQKEHCFPAKQGVGLARKYLGDLGFCLNFQSSLVSNYCFHSDGDSILPSSYFEEIDRTASDVSCFLFRFSHLQSSLNDTEFEALKIYEESLSYYEEGLRFAGSIYDYTPIGSCLVHSHSEYAKAHGFPLRLAGEDFYLVNKLRKLGRVISLNKSPKIILQGRTFSRTPFGTAKKTLEWSKKLANFDRIKFYDFEVFHRLREVLQHYQFDEISFQPLREETQRVLEELRLKTKLDSLRNSSLSSAQKKREFLNTFDGFYQLRFIQELTRRYFPKKEISVYRQQHRTYSPSHGKATNQSRVHA